MPKNLNMSRKGKPDWGAKEYNSKKKKKRMHVFLNMIYAIIYRYIYIYYIHIYIIVLWHKYNVTSGWPMIIRESSSSSALRKSKENSFSVILCSSQSESMTLTTNNIYQIKFTTQKKKIYFLTNYSIRWQMGDPKEKWGIFFLAQKPTHTQLTHKANANKKKCSGFFCCWMPSNFYFSWRAPGRGGVGKQIIKCWCVD